MGIIEASYLVVKVKKDGEFDYWTVSKFEGKNEPSSIYNVVVDGKPIGCDCGAYKTKKSCKHMDMVKDKIDKGEVDSCKEIFGKSFEESYSEMMSLIGVEVKPEELKTKKVETQVREIPDYVIKDRIIEDLIE